MFDITRRGTRMGHNAPACIRPVAWNGDIGQTIVRLAGDIGAYRPPEFIRLVVAEQGVQRAAIGIERPVQSADSLKRTVFAGHVDDEAD